jgi:hypothetical protein
MMAQTQSFGAYNTTHGGVMESACCYLGWLALPDPEFVVWLASIEVLSRDNSTTDTSSSNHK